MKTHVFTLLCGLEAEVTKMTGKHQEMLTVNGNKFFEKKLLDLCKDVLVRVGDKTTFTDADIKQLYVADRKLILFETRQFALNHDPVFKFDYEYTDNNGRKKKHPMEVTMPDTEELKTPFKAQVKSWDEMEKTVAVELEDLGETVYFEMLDGYGEARGAAVPKNKWSANTAIRMRNLHKMKKTEADTVAVAVEPNTLSLLDIEKVRATIHEHEGRIDTEIMFEHPETGEDVTIEALGTLGFYFPSRAI